MKRGLSLATSSMQYVLRSIIAYSSQSVHGTVTECTWTHTANIGWLPLALLMTYIFFFNLGYGSMIWITVAEILPIHVRCVTTN